jgi:hypothetical protein
MMPEWHVWQHFLQEEFSNGHILVLIFNYPV